MDNGPTNRIHSSDTSLPPAQAANRPGSGYLGAARQGWSQSCGSCVNVGESERQASLIGGSILALLGVMRGSLPGLLMVAAGGALAYRGLTGHCHVYEALGYSTAEEAPQQAVSSWTE